MKKNLYFYAVFLMLSLLAFESYAQKFSPDSSLFVIFYRNVFGKEYTPNYFPSKGLWRFLGWSGSACMCILLLYSVRKRAKALKQWGSIKDWLAAHIFLGVMGPIFIFFHATFKFGGLISAGFWSMSIVFISGFFGRYIYGQIPRGIKGNELSLKEIEEEIKIANDELVTYEGEGGKKHRINISEMLSQIVILKPKKDSNVIASLIQMVSNNVKNLYFVYHLKAKLKNDNTFSPEEVKKISDLINKKVGITRKVNFLAVSQQLLHYWHVLHLNLCVVLYITMIVHIVVYFLFKT